MNKKSNKMNTLFLFNHAVKNLGIIQNKNFKYAPFVQISSRDIYSIEFFNWIPLTTQICLFITFIMSSSSSTHHRQLFLRQLVQTCPESMTNLKAYLSSYSNLIAPSYKKTRDPLAMKELSSKCPSCSHSYTINAFRYRGKLQANRRLHYLLSIRRKYKRIPTPNTYKRRLLDQFANKSRSKLLIKCSQCGETRTFQGATRKEISQPPPRLSLPKPVNTVKLKQQFEKVSCRFLKKESNLRAFLEQL